MKQFMLILIMVAMMSQVAAQKDFVVVRPLTTSITPKTAIKQYIYMETSEGIPWALYTANNNTHSILDSLHKSSFGIGIHSFVSFLTFQRHRYDPMADIASELINRNGLTFSIGYTHDRFAYEKDRWSNAGFQSHWLTLDALFIFQIIPFLPSFVLGGRCDIFLGASTVSNDGWDYNGINPDCYKRITISTVTGFRLSTSNFFLDFYIDLGSKLNKDKIMYYNEVYSYNDMGDYVQFRLGYRFFTPAKKTL